MDYRNTVMKIIKIINVDETQIFAANRLEIILIILTFIIIIINFLNYSTIYL